MQKISIFRKKSKFDYDYEFSNIYAPDFSKITNLLETGSQKLSNNDIRFRVKKLANI